MFALSVENFLQFLKFGVQLLQLGETFFLAALEVTCIVRVPFREVHFRTGFDEVLFHCDSFAPYFTNRSATTM